jgi:hypothetical protein
MFAGKKNETFSFNISGNVGAEFSKNTNLLQY